MPTGHHPLTHPERSPIFALQSTGRSQRPMAEPLGRDVSPISQELSRHRGQRGDRHQQAQGKATSRRREASAVPWKMTPERWAVVEDRLQAGWSPLPVPAASREEAELAGRAICGTRSPSRSRRHRRTPGGWGRPRAGRGLGARPVHRGDAPGSLDFLGGSGLEVHGADSGGREAGGRDRGHCPIKKPYLVSGRKRLFFGRPGSVRRQFPQQNNRQSL